MDQLIGRYAGFLKKGRQDLVDAVKDLSPEELHFTHNGTVNSIAMILKHSEAAEQFLIHKLIADDPIPTRAVKPFEEGNEALPDLLAALEKSQKRTMEILENLKDDELLEKKEIRLSSGPATVTNEWGIIHALEHEAHHKGQVVLMKRLART